VAGLEQLCQYDVLDNEAAWNSRPSSELRNIMLSASA
jgi:hypothetical protein